MICNNNHSQKSKGSYSLFRILGSVLPKDHSSPAIANIFHKFHRNTNSLCLLEILSCHELCSFLFDFTPKSHLFYTILHLAIAITNFPILLKSFEFRDFIHKRFRYYPLWLKTSKVVDCLHI